MEFANLLKQIVPLRWFDLHETDQTQAGIPKRRPDGSALRQAVTLVAAPLAARGGSRSPWPRRWAVPQLAPHLLLKIDGGVWFATLNSLVLMS